MKQFLEKIRSLLGERYRTDSVEIGPTQARELQGVLDTIESFSQAERIIVRGQVMFPYDMYFGDHSDQWHRMMAHPEALESEQIRERLVATGFDVSKFGDPTVEQLEAIGFVNLNALSGP